jgi:VIT1/CCC1 family predicted Fe2+/Mn2+ transporter
MTTTEMAARPASRWVEAERATLREILMGAQDNLTNVLAVVLGVSIGAGRAELVGLAGLSAAVAEAISMGGVLYTATRAEADLEPGRVSRLSPLAAGVVCAVAALLGGLVPLVPFLLLPIGLAVAASLTTSLCALFVLGAWSATVTRRTWWRDGVRLVFIAGAAAVAAALIGHALRVD